MMKSAEAVTRDRSVGWAKRLVRRSSTSEGGSVPTITSRMLDGGHGASAPLPTLRSSHARHGRACPGHPRLSICGVAKTWMPGTRPGMTKIVRSSSALEHAAEHLFEDLALDVLVGELAVVPPPAVLLHLGRGGDEAVGDLVEVGIGVVEAEDQPSRADPAQRETLGAQVILQHPVVAGGRRVADRPDRGQVGN